MKIKIGAEIEAERVRYLLAVNEEDGGLNTTLNTNLQKARSTWLTNSKRLFYVKPYGQEKESLNIIEKIATSVEYSRNAEWLKTIPADRLIPSAKFEIKQEKIVFSQTSSDPLEIIYQMMRARGFKKLETEPESLVVSQYLEIEKTNPELVEQIIKEAKQINQKEIELAENVFYKIDTLQLEAHLNKINKDIEHILETSWALEPSYDFEIKDVKTELFPYQKAGVEFIANNRKVLNLDEMGLGKSLQSLAGIMKIRENENIRTIIVCQASLAENWQAEIENHLENVTCYIQENSSKLPKQLYDFYILPLSRINLNSEAWAEYYSNYDAIIIDEIHNIKSPRTAQTANVMRLAANKSVRIGLTGTIYVNNPKDCICPMESLGIFEKTFYSESFFTRTFCHERAKKDPQTVGKIQVMLRKSGNVICRSKKAAWKNDPGKEILDNIYCELSNKEEYKQAVQNFIKWYLERLKSLNNGEEWAQAKLLAALKAETLVKIGKLRALAGKGKINASVAYARDLADKNPSDKIIIFATFKEALEGIGEALGCKTITGTTPAKQRYQIIKDFNTNQEKFLVLSLRCAGTGLNITGANHVIFAEYSWTMKDHSQAMDRVHRIGQTKKCFIHYIHAEESIDDWMKELVEGKGFLNQGATQKWLLTQGPVDEADQKLIEKFTPHTKEKEDTEDAITKAFNSIE